MRGERPLLSRTIFLYHIFKINLTLVCYGRSIEVRKIGKLLLERHKGGRDRLIDVAAQVFSFPQLFRVFDYSGAPNNGFLLNTLESFFRLYRVL